MTSWSTCCTTSAKLVEFALMEPLDLADAYFGLLDELRALLGTDVDLVVSRH